MQHKNKTEYYIYIVSFKVTLLLYQLMLPDINIASIFTRITMINDDNIHVKMYGIDVVL